MKTSFSRLLTVSLVLLSIMTFEAYTQAVYFYKIFDDKFPTMRIQWIARRDGGDSLAIPWEQFRIKENGVSKDATIRIDCGEKPLPETTVMFLIDVSTSMTEKVDIARNETILDWAKFAVNAFLDSVKFIDDTKIALVFFANGTKWADGQTQCVGFKGGEDVQTIKDAFNTVKISAGKTDFSLAFYGTTIRPFLEMMKRPSTIQRHLIMITDGEPDALFNAPIQDSVIKLARMSKTFVHALSIKEPVNVGLQYVTSQTGGARMHATTKNQCRTSLLSLVNKVQRKWFCDLSWDTDYTCDESGRNRTINITRVSAVGTENIHDTLYKAPANSVDNLTLSKSDILFGQVGTPKAESTVKLDYTGGNYTFKGMKFEPNDCFIVKSWGGSSPPFTIKHGDSRTITIAYPTEAPTVSKKVKVTLDLENYPCQLPTMELVSLCNGVSITSSVFDSTMTNETSLLNLDCAFKNRTAIPIQVTATLKGANVGEFEILSQKSQLINPAGCMQLEIAFKPKSSGEKTAYIEYTLPDDCGISYKTDLSGKAVINSIDEYYTGSGFSGRMLKADPTPASETLHLKFSIKSHSGVRIELFNTVGAKIETLLDKELTEGSYEAAYTVSALEPGVYFLQISAGSETETQRVLIIR